MAVRLRLRRVGRKKLPIYKVVATDRRSPRDGRYIEVIGQYEPLRPANNVEFNEDRVLYWLQNGAQPTDTVRNLLQGKGLWLKWSLIRKGVDENTITQELEKFKTQRAEKERQSQEVTAQPSPEVQEPPAPEAEQPGAPEEKQNMPDQEEENEKTQETPEAKQSSDDEPGERKEDTDKKE